MAGGKSYLAAAKPNKSFFQENAKVVAPAPVTDKTSTGPAPIKVAPVSMTAAYANAAKSGMAQTSYTNKLAVWNKNAAPSLAAQPTVSAPGSFAHVAASRAPDVIPTAWKKDSKNKSTARAPSPSSDSVKSTATKISTKGPKPVPVNNKKPVRATAKSSGDSYKMVIPQGMPVARSPSTPLQAPVEFMTATARREMEDAKVWGSAGFFGGEHNTKASRLSSSYSSSASSPEAAKASKAVEQPQSPVLTLSDVPKSTKQTKFVEKPALSSEKASSKNAASIKLTGNGGAAHLAAPVSAPSSAQPKKNTGAKSYSQMAASVPSVPIKKAEDENKALVPQPKTEQQLVATEKKSQRKNKKKGSKSTETVASPSVPQTVDTTKKVHVKDAAPTLALTPTTGSVSITSGHIQVAEIASTPAKENVVFTESAQGMPITSRFSSNQSNFCVDPTLESGAQDAPVATKTGRKHKKSGAQRKKEKKARTPEQVDAIAAANASADLEKKIATQIATIKALAESDAARRELPMRYYDILYVASRDNEDVMALNKQRAEEALRAALLENAAKEAGHCVKVADLSSYMWFYDACAQPVIQSRAAELLETADSDSQVESIASPPQGTVKQRQMAKKKDIKLRMAIAEDGMSETSPSVLPEELSLAAPTDSFSFGTSPLPGVSVVSVLPPLTASYKFGLAPTTPIVFGASNVSPEIEKLAPTELDTTELQVAEAELTELEVSESTSLNAVANQSTTTIITTAETSESNGVTTDTDTNTSLDSDEGPSPTDDQSELSTTHEKIFEPLSATTQNVGSFKTGTGLVLAVDDEVSYAASKVTETSMPVAIYHGSDLPVFASALSAPADKNPLEISQIVFTTEDLKAFVPVLPLSVFGPVVAPKTGLDIPTPHTALRLAAYIGTLRNVPDGLPGTLDLPAAPVHEPAQLEHTVTVYAPPQAAPITHHADTPHRIINTQIGIVMLGEFLRQLYSPVAPTYTIMELVEAFLAMSNFERVFLDVGDAHPYSANQVRNYKHLQSRVMIGSIKLWDFLAALKLNENGDVTLRALVDGWAACAIEDAKAEDLHMQVKEAMEEDM